ncbi:MAG: hypothetical protein G01um10145_929 [Microgenomates group bacterium Gr01-1014_5]|nr:MAG: hypothetical protein G01um10145_929 [Microgenomates group bacterium Gr01-1014_5]
MKFATIPMNNMAERFGRRTFLRLLPVAPVVAEVAFATACSPFVEQSLPEDTSSWKEFRVPATEETSARINGGLQSICTGLTEIRITNSHRIPILFIFACFDENTVQNKESANEKIYVQPVDDTFTPDPSRFTREYERSPKENRDYYDFMQKQMALIPESALDKPNFLATVPRPFGEVPSTLVFSPGLVTFMGKPSPQFHLRIKLVFEEKSAKLSK